MKTIIGLNSTYMLMMQVDKKKQNWFVFTALLIWVLIQCLVLFQLLFWGAQGAALHCLVILGSAAGSVKWAYLNIWQEDNPHFPYIFVTSNGDYCNAFYMGHSFKALTICRWSRTFQPTSLAAFHAESSLFWPFKWLFKWFGTHLAKKQPVSFRVSCTAEVTWGTSAKSPFMVINEQEEADGKVLSVWSPWLWTKFNYFFLGSLKN